MANAHNTPFFPLGGGLDLITPMVAQKPGRAVAALNYAPVATGYRRFIGFERFDGSAAPSTRTFYQINFTGGSSQIAAGDEIRRHTYDEGTVISVTLTSGAWGSNAAGHLIVAMAGPASASSGGIIYKRSAGVDTLSASASGAPTLVTGDLSPYLSAAPALARAKIGPVPGSGPVRFVFAWEGRVHAVRDNVAGTAGVMYYSGRFGSPGSNYAVDGWKTVAIGSTARFDQGGIDGQELVEGDTYDKTSGFAGLVYYINRVVVTSGSWEDGDASGYIVTSAATPPWTAGDYLYPSSHDQALRAARISTTATAIALPPGGDYSAIVHNFYGASDRTRLYLANGVGNAFELGTYTEGGSEVLRLTAIFTGMPVDKPTRVAEHRNSLFLAFPGGSVQFSAIGEPLVFDPILGAGELGVGNEIMDFAAPPNSLAILGERNIHILYGSDASDYQVERLSDSSGALPHTAQEIGAVIYMDNRGLRRLDAAQSFGNFTMGTISRLVQPLLEDYRNDGVHPTASLISRTADQYWVFFDNGTGLVVYMGRKEAEILPFNLGKVVTATTSTEQDGEERIFVGCSDGFVYELNRGTSFDGEPIEAYIRLPFNHFGAPQQKKRIHKVLVDVEASGPTTINVSAALDNGSVQGIEPQALTITTGGGAIDDLGSNELYFASQIETIAETYMDGVFTNISLKIASESAVEQAHTVTGVTYHITGRGQKR